MNGENTLQDTSQNSRRRHNRPNALDSDDDDVQEENVLNDKTNQHDNKVIADEEITSEPIEEDFQILVFAKNLSFC